jgi:hypothetical protein
MSSTEWEEWKLHLKTVIMGTRLGGLMPSPLFHRNGYYRDPDGLCTVS